MARHHLLLAALTSLSVLIAGCGSTDVDDGPRVADTRFDGRWEIVMVTLDGVDQGLAQEPTMEIDAEFGALAVNPGCTVQLGSFTLADDGRASFRITGGSRRPCDDLADQEAAVLAALDGAETWTAIDGGFRFDGPATSISISGPIDEPETAGGNGPVLAIESGRLSHRFGTGIERGYPMLDASWPSQSMVA